MRTICALSPGALALVAGDLTELQPMKQLTATIGYDGSQATSTGCRCASEPGNVSHHLVLLT